MRFQLTLIPVDERALTVGFVGVATNVLADGKEVPFSLAAVTL